MDAVFHARCVAGKTETSGDVFVSLGNKARGPFAEWNWDGKTLTLTNDRYGFYPIYYLRRENELAVSASISRLLELAGDVEFDDAAFSVLLRFGWLIAEDTLFSAIRAVPPGSTLTWQNGELTIASARVIELQPLSISRPDAIATYAELFQRAVEATLPADDNFLVPLSGGRDSRHILFSVCKVNRRPECLTILHPPPRPNEDARISRQICETLGLEHELLEQTNSRFENEIRKNELTGFSVYEHGWFLPLARVVRERRLPVYDGIAGDVLSAGLFLTEERLRLFRQGKLEELADRILEPEGYLPKLLSAPAYRTFSREKAVRHLVKELARHQNQPNPVGSFYFWNRTRRCIAPSPFRLFGDSAEILTPYLDSELFEFLAALPADMMLDHQFHTDTIAFAFPEYAHIPYEDKIASPNLDFTSLSHLSRDIFRYSRTKRDRQLTNPFFLLSRYARALIDKRYGRAVAEFGEQAIHLLQLERLTTTGASLGRLKPAA